MNARVIGVGVLLAVTLAAAGGETTAPILAEADDLLARDRPRDAVALLLGSGQRLVHGGALDDGAVLLERARDLAPEVGAVRGALGFARLQQRRFADAVLELRAARAAGEGGPVVGLYLGSALWEQGRHDEAEAELRGALANPGAPERELLQALGGLLLWSGRYEESVDHLQRAIAAGGDGARTRLDLARAQEGAGRRDEAIASYRRALELAPEAFRARYNLARLLRQAGLDDEARREMDRFSRDHAADQAATREAGLARGRLDLGLEHLRAGRAREALAVFADLPPTADGLVGFARASAALGDHRAAVRALEQALILAPDRADVRLLWARERVEAGLEEGS